MRGRASLLLLLLLSMYALLLLAVGATDAPAAAASASPLPAMARDDDPAIKDVRALRNAAMALMDKREYAQSIAKLRAAITTMHDRVFGDSRTLITDPKEQSMDAAYYAQLLGDYGNVLVRDAQYDEATDVLEDATAMTRKIFGASHPSFGLLMRSLADAYMAKQQYQQALQTYKELRRHIALGLGPTHEAYVEASLRIGECFRRLGKLKRAAAVYEKAIAKEPDVATKGVGELFMELATVQNLLNRTIDAERNAEVACDMLRTRDGSDSIAFAFSLNALAGVKMQLQQREKALELLKDAHAIALQVYGADHTIVKASAKTLRDVEAQLSAQAAAAEETRSSDEL